MIGELAGHIVVGVVVVASATVALCLGNITEAAYLGAIGVGIAPAAVKAARPG